MMITEVWSDRHSAFVRQFYAGHQLIFQLAPFRVSHARNRSSLFQQSFQLDLEIQARHVVQSEQYWAI